MEQIIVQKPGGGQLPLFRQSPLSGVTKAEQVKQLIGEDYVTLTVESAARLDLSIGDSIIVFGDEYVLNTMPTARKNGEDRFVYELKFEGAQYQLLRVLYFNTDVSGFATGTEFSLTGDLTMFAGVLQNNINRVLKNWTLGVVPTGTPTKTLTFSNENCLAVLQKICQEYETEFEIVRSATGSKTLTIKKVGQLLGQTFEYGRGHGLYSLQRESVTDSGFITRLYAFGASKNLPSTYRAFSPRLKMDTPGSYLEKLDAKLAFGLIEGTKNFDDIYPQRTGTVTTVTGRTVFSDASMDFDLLAESGPPVVVGKKSTKQYSHLVGGMSAKVHFNSGNLAGYEFELETYDHATKTFTLLAFTDERGLELPSRDAQPGFGFNIAPGDKYVLLDILMPQSYADAAEAALKVAAQTYLDNTSAPRVQYRLEVDELYLKSRSAAGATTNHFSLGDVLEIKDADLFINGGSRIISFTRDVLHPYRYSLEIADSYEISLIERILTEQAETKTIIRINDLRDGARARYGWRSTQELLSLVFDPDDYFKGGNIRPESIETSMIVVGAKSQQFILNVVIEPNFQGQVNTVKVNPGSLTHYTVEETIRTWQVIGQTTIIADTGPRYIYARCHRNNPNDASLLFSTAQIKPNDDAVYYHFLIGVLHGKDSGVAVRWISLTYGATAINGRFIKTGRIQSFDGSTYFDLDAGEIGGKITFIATDGKTRPITELTETTIDAGVITSGSIQLAGRTADGQPGAAKAGITGEGTADSSVRIWAGTSRANRAAAPFRVLQSGELFARKRIELMNEANVGQAGIAGSNTVLDGTVRFWAGSPYAGRNTAPYRVNADGSMTATRGTIGNWEITPSGFVNNDHSAYIITRSSTNPMRTEARIGANVLPGTSGDKAAALFVATEPDKTSINYAAVFRAANGRENFAIHAMQGVSMFGELLVNGRRYLGRTVRDITLVVDPTEYDMIEIFPQGTSAGLTFETPDERKSLLKNGKTVIIFNGNDQFDLFHLYNVMRAQPKWQISAGTIVTLVLSCGVWNCVSSFNNTFGASEPNFAVPVANPAPTVGAAMPPRTISTRTVTTVTIPDGAFVDSGDQLNYEVDSLPPGITFAGGSRTFTVDSSTPNGTYPIRVRVTDSAGQSVAATQTIIVDRPALNPGPTLEVPLGGIDVTGKGVFSLVIPAETFTDTDALTYSATAVGGGALPTGITFAGSSRTLSVAATVPDGVYQAVIIATDTAAQVASDTLEITVKRSLVNTTPTVANPVPDQSVNGAGSKSFTVAANTFSDPGDTLTLSATLGSGAPLPTGISFDAATRTVVVAETVASGTYAILLKATDTAGLFATDLFDIVVDRTAVAPPANPAPTVQTPIADQRISGADTANRTIALSAATFSDPGDTLTLSATLVGGGALPAGISFNPATATFTVLRSSVNGVHQIEVTATDSRGQSVSDSFALTIDFANSGGGRLPAVGGMQNRTFANVIRSQIPSADPELMNLVFTIVDGRLIATETATLVAPPGWTLWYSVDDDGFTQTLDPGGYPIGYPHIFRRFLVPPGRTPTGNGQPESGYRDQPVRNAYQIVSAQ